MLVGRQLKFILGKDWLHDFIFLTREVIQYGMWRVFFKPLDSRPLDVMLGEERKKARMTVYITHEMRGRDISNALEYGALKVILPAEIQVIDNPTQKKIVVDLIEETPKDFGDNDYLLLSGDPACIGICFGVAALNNNGRVKMLKWDRHEEAYFPLDITLEIGSEGDEY